MRILVVKLSSLGDVAHAVPAVAALAQRYPGSEIDWLVEPPGARFVAGLPWVSEAVVLDARGALARGARALASERNRVASRLKRRLLAWIPRLLPCRVCARARCHLPHRS